MSDEKPMTASEAASEGGKARAEKLTPEERSAIAKRAAESRWNSDVPCATHTGEIIIAGNKIACAVLEDGRRLLTQDAFLKAIGRSPKGKGGQSTTSPDGLPPFLAAESIKPFVSEELRKATVPVFFRTAQGTKAFGYEANLLPMVCDVYVEAKIEGKTTAQQDHIVRACQALRKGLGEIGVVALVDEATGYQEVRDRQALQAYLDRFLRKEFANWAKRFPDDFYREIFRLRGWTWKGMKVNRPQCVAQYTKDLVYSRLAPGVLSELETRNPKDDSGRRVSKHHQWLTEDVGHPALAQHLYGVIGFLRVAESWEQMKKMIDKAYPKRGDTLDYPLFSLDD